MQAPPHCQIFNYGGNSSYRSQLRMRIEVKFPHSVKGIKTIISCNLCLFSSISQKIGKIVPIDWLGGGSGLDGLEGLEGLGDMWSASLTPTRRSSQSGNLTRWYMYCSPLHIIGLAPKRLKASERFWSNQCLQKCQTRWEDKFKLKAVSGVADKFRCSMREHFRTFLAADQPWAVRAWNESGM